MSRSWSPLGRAGGRLVSGFVSGPPISQSDRVHTGWHEDEVRQARQPGLTPSEAHRRPRDGPADEPSHNPKVAGSNPAAEPINELRGESTVIGLAECGAIGEEDVENLHGRDKRDGDD
jgi:hypothetical protein